MENLVHDYREKEGYTQFNALLSGLYREYFEELVDAHSEYRELVQVNEWLPTKEGDWKFNKSAFAGKDEIPRDYSQHLYKVEIAAAKMRCAFKKLEALSDLEIWQCLYPIARRYVAKRIPPLPKSHSNPEVARRAS